MFIKDIDEISDSMLKRTEEKFHSMTSEDFITQSFQRSLTSKTALRKLFFYSVLINNFSDELCTTQDFLIQLSLF